MIRSYATINVEVNLFLKTKEGNISCGGEIGKKLCIHDFTELEKRNMKIYNS